MVLGDALLGHNHLKKLTVHQDYVYTRSTVHTPSTRTQRQRFIQRMRTHNLQLPA